MKNAERLLITGGCSYSEIPNRDDAWPLHLQNETYFRYVAHTGHGAAGNGLISRKVISKVLQALDQGFPTEDIIVGVIWSGCDRMTHYSPNLDYTLPKANQIGYGNGLEDFKGSIKYNNDMMLPIPFVDLEGERNFSHQHQNHSNPAFIRNYENPSHYIMNPHWVDEKTTLYFEHFVNPQKAIIETCEHILRTEHFLKSKNIKYFFSEYDFDVFHYTGPNYGISRSTYPGMRSPEDTVLSIDSEAHQWPNTYTKEMHEQHLNDPEIEYLYHAIDRSYFLPIKHLQDWVTNVSKFKHRDINPDTGLPRDPHPSTEQHKDFVAKVVLPFLLEKYNLSSYNV